MTSQYAPPNAPPAGGWAPPTPQQFAAQAGVQAPQQELVNVSLRHSAAIKVMPLDETWVTVLSLRWDVRGYRADNNPALANLRTLAVVARYLPDGADPQSGVTEQMYSAGKPERYEIAESGTKILGRGKANTGIAESTNASLLFEALEKSGVPVQMLDANNLALFDGARFYLRQVAQPEREGLASAVATPTGGQRQRTTPVPVQVILPGQSAPAAVGGSGPTATPLPASQPAPIPAPTFVPVAPAWAVPQPQLQPVAAAPVAIAPSPVPSTAPMPAPQPQMVGANGISPDVTAKAQSELSAFAANKRQANIGMSQRGELASFILGRYNPTDPKLGVAIIRVVNDNGFLEGARQAGVIRGYDAASIAF